MPSCAFLSISNTDGWFIDDDLVHPPLRDLGWQIENVPWDKAVDWDQFDVVVIRSPWDYQDHLDKFMRVLEDIDRSSAILLNSLESIRWNINKHYLFELAEKGAQLIPSIKLFSPKKADIRESFDRFGTDDIIIKPMIGANADDTYRINTHVQGDISKIFDKRACMIQPFMKSVVEEGEYSVMYFNGRRSHTILKTVGHNDFRVQEEHGGGVVPIESPEPALLQAADRAMAAVGYDTLYARVDLVRSVQNSFALMELELIEPALYFRFAENSAKEFAACIDQTWKDQMKN